MFFYVLTLAVVTRGDTSLKRITEMYIKDMFTFLYDSDASIFKRPNVLKKVTGGTPSSQPWRWPETLL